MNPEEIKELADAAGESHWRRVAPLELNEVSLNGDGAVDEVSPGNFVRKGGFFRKRILASRRNRNEKPEEINLGGSITIVFLRKRRKLVERGGTDGKIVRSTNEHDHPKNAITLYDEFNQAETGVAADLRAKYPQLRTVEIIYALLITPTHEPELVRIPVKGASLGSESKADTTTDLYSYLTSFAGNDHIWQYFTELSPVLETGKQPYFAIDFKCGERIAEEMIADIVAPALRRVRDNCAAVDQSRAEKIAAGTTVPTAEPEGEVQEGAAIGAEYPKGADTFSQDDDIDSSIPF